MFTTERFFRPIWAGWLVTVMVSLMAFAVGPKPLAALVSAASAVTLFWCVKCAYCSERFSEYASFKLYILLSLGPALTFLILLTSTYKIDGWHWAPSLAVSALPAFLFGLIYLIIYTSKSKTDPFVLLGKRVVVDEPPQSGNAVLVGISSILLSLIYPAMEQHDMIVESLLFLGMLLSLLSLHHCRTHIVSLKALKERERREGIHYTFQDIEHIRELRQASFLGRLFAPKNKN